jgi:sialate O-acetylesterase
VHWTIPTKEEVEKFSGVAIFFGVDLFKNLNVPIGLIQSAHGGASLETFVSRNAIDNSNEFKSIGTNSDKSFALYQDSLDQYKKDIQTWFANGKTGDKPEEPAPPRMKKASVAYDTLLAPVAPISLRGAIFYQGEADVYLSALRYRRLFALMVSDWRNQFKDPTLPVIFVQLPNYGAKQKIPEDSDWAIMRETQAICRRIPYTYMVVTLDTIPGADAGMHATQKKEIARRLASVALATQYHVSRPYASPIYDSMEIQGRKVRIKFRYADKGLISNSLPIQGFEIAGENKRWTSADAQVDGDCVIVSSPRVPAPAAVRYGWADNPTINLYSADKLPVTPFRTDDWPRLTQKKSY